MDVRKALLVKSLKELMTITANTITTNASHRYPRGGGQNEYKFAKC